MTTLRIALAQINPTVGDLGGNVEKILSGMERARKNHADIVTFPELAICGYPPEDLLLKPGFVADCRGALDEVAKRSEGGTALIGFPDSADGRVYNAAAVLDGSEMVGVYHKLELPNYGVFDEKRYFSPGTRRLFLDVRGARIAVTICEDVWVEEVAAELCLAEGAQVALNISASPFHAGKVALRCQVLSGFARRTGSFVCYTNLVGGQDELVFDGGSMVLSAEGEVLARAKRFEEDFLIADIDVEKAGGEVARGGSAAVGREVIRPINRYSSKRKPMTMRPARELDRLEEVYEALVLGVRDYVRKNGFEKAVLGLSGGIDSSLVAAIVSDALGEGNVIGLTMPSQYTSGETRSDAECVAKNLNIRLITVPIEGVFSGYVDALKESFGEDGSGVEYENVQARIRGNILMAFSNRYGWLVVTTGNKSETAVGYCTLYGDTAGGFAVIKDVPKTMVYELAEYVNRKAGRDVMPQSVLDRPPSAELKPGQKDEDSLPPYAVLDPILRAYVEEDKTAKDIAATGFDIELVEKIVRMVDCNEYKRRQAPPGVKITPKAFGRDRRLPITNGCRSRGE